MQKKEITSVTKVRMFIPQTEVEEEVPVLMAPLASSEKAPETVDSTKNVEPEKREAVSVSGEPPRFVVSLNDATVEEGARLTFECRIHACPEPEVVWYKDGISILNNPDYQTSFDAVTGSCTLTIEETFAEDSAKYTCKAFNYLGLAETSAILTVKGTVLNAYEIHLYNVLILMVLNATTKTIVYSIVDILQFRFIFINIIFSLVNGANDFLHFHTCLTSHQAFLRQ